MLTPRQKLNECKARRIPWHKMPKDAAYLWWSDEERENRATARNGALDPDVREYASYEAEDAHRWRERYVRNRLATRALRRAIDNHVRAA